MEPGLFVAEGGHGVEAAGAECGDVGGGAGALKFG